MTSTIRDEIWAWKGTFDWEKHLGLIIFAIFWVVWKERNRRTFDGVEEGTNKLRERWFLALGFLVIGQPLYSMEDLRELIGTLLTCK